MRKGIVLSIISFVLTITVDILLKNLHSYSDTSHFNRGFIFGTLQDLPANLTLVTLSSIGGVLIFIYLILILLLSSELIVFKVGLGFLAGGILGNVVDRAIHGGTLDFIPLAFGGEALVFFNPADAFQWLGAVVIVYNILKNDDIIWYPENQRSFGLINPKDQIRFAVKFTVISFSTCLILGIFSISYLTMALTQTGNHSMSQVVGYAISFIAISIIFNCLTFFAGIILSNKSAGPLYAFEKYVEALLSGEMKELKLREGDNYQHLVKVANSLKTHFERK
jgi:signal peptidase II